MRTKNYLITGASSGIGRAVLNQLILQGFTVYNIDIVTPQKVFEKEIFIKFDLSNYMSIDAILPKDIDFDGVFFNAGIHQSGSIFSQSLDEINKCISINLMSSIVILKSLVENIKPGASIVFNGSDQCFVGKTNNFAYGLTKGAIAQITKSLALDLSPKNIRVNTVCPSTTDTPLYRKAIEKYSLASGIDLADIEKSEAEEIPINRVATSEEVANVVIFLLSDKSSFMTGSLVPVDGGYTAR
ncbi:SDR family NAD(P)-dependent oxidoreductase [Francisella philomiragia]|uniref:Short chain dehydrogenase family protein n=1 Tax=Francisella philomiragia TaxID=28110 RepID=A0A0B6CPI4_9GAMM|nr:SDR family oxidoreductase [Francisella philomiragia]AJI52394.1 short chain dehydrogenase family protein [Francisella philomiragia]